ncbi:MAG: response regulator [Firmicutes bacterium]|nr:response regulator [Bacillota bacterium]
MARILIVDDSFVARMCLSNIMIALGHIVVGEAVDGKQAFDEYARLKPDIVTMDLNMDGSDGVQAMSAILAEFPEARIVIVSARQENKIIFDALERGARHFIMKPVSPEKVIVVLNNVLQQTFDKQKHLEFISRLKKTYDSDNSLLAANKHRSARVLIVDDSAVARKILREIITELGHVVVGEAANGAQAFVEYAKLHPDLVTMDLTMEGLGGAEAISKIVAVDSQARIVVISSMEVRQGIIDALERGARHFILKPIRKDKVAIVLNNVLQQEFNLQKHIECLRKMKEREDSLVLVDAAKKVIPPYAISISDKSLLHVFINQSITLTGCQTLFLELEEHLNSTPRVLLDFGTMSSLEEQLLIKINELVEAIENNSGMVKAISNDKRFVDTIAATQIENKANALADILRFFEH